MYRWGFAEASSADDLILRISLDDTEVVFDEGLDPILKMHASKLVTGP